jgi:hypothetical protein
MPVPPFGRVFSAATLAAVRTAAIAAAATGGATSDRRIVEIYAGSLGFLGESDASCGSRAFQHIEQRRAVTARATSAPTTRTAGATTATAGPASASGATVAAEGVLLWVALYVSQNDDDAHECYAQQHEQKQGVIPQQRGGGKQGSHEDRPSPVAPTHRLIL